jgi:putative peptide zinc metalloprotease protein
MNILEALDVALPELPAKSVQKRYPRLDSRVIAREHVEQGARVVLAKMPGTDIYLRFTPEQWKLAQLFDGRRTFGEIADLIFEQAGIPFTEDDVKEFASYLQEQGDLFYKTPLEKSIVLKQKMRGERHKRSRFHVADVTDITLHRWPKADAYLTRIQPYVEFIYTRWFTLLTLCMFAAMIWMWADRMGEIWRDSFAFYDFTAKTGWDLAEFWFLFGAMAFFHESAHGMTCKHFGARVEKIEFLLMFFAPTFVCDTTQIWILGDRKARLATVIAGIWVDLIICVFATTVWFTTATGMFIHDFAYKVMMVTGIGVTLLNLNPLIKLDGYYMLSEILGEPDLKERSTAYVSGWVRKHLFRLPVDLEYVPRRRRVLYIVYALLSGAYSYLLMYVVVIFAYHILRSFIPDWAWVPALGLAYFIFRSRIRLLERFMKTLYLDKKERVQRWLTPGRAAVLGACVLLLLFAPVWQDSVAGRFLLEPAHRALLRAQVPGTVTRVFADEGEKVAANAPLVQLRNFSLESEVQHANADLQAANSKAIAAQIAYRGAAQAEYARRQIAARSSALSDQAARLQIVTPVAGVVATPRLHDLVGRYVSPGTVVAEVADPSVLIARIYIPEFAMREVRPGAPVRLQAQSRVRPVSASLLSVSPNATPIAEGLVDKSELQGLRPPKYYAGAAELMNPGDLLAGGTGTAKIFVARRSLAGLAWRFLGDLAWRRIW